jgi:nucleoside phosphorylase
MTNWSAEGKRIAALYCALADSEVGPGRSVLVDQLIAEVRTAKPEVAALLSCVLAANTDTATKDWGRDLLASLNVAPEQMVEFFTRPPRVDVLILTIKEVEWNATLRAFGVPVGEAPSRVGTFDEMMFVTRGDLTFGIAYIGFAGNVESAIRVAELIRHVEFRAAVLIGMAAGVEHEVKLGDVVLSESVIAFEYVTLTSDGPVYSPVVHTVPMRRVRFARTVSQVDPDWGARLRAEIRRADGFVEIPPDEPERLDESWTCSIRTGAILAGTKLIEDGSLPRLKKELGDRVKAAEMEGAGFASMCSEAGIDWLVVRGIADYGNPKRSKGWQFAASYAAAAFVRDGLANGRISLS